MKTVDHNPDSNALLKGAVVVAITALKDALQAAERPHCVFALVLIDADSAESARDVQVASNLAPEMAQEMFAMLAGLGKPSIQPLTRQPN